MAIGNGLATSQAGTHFMKLYNTPKAPNPNRVTFFLRAKGKLDEVDLEDISIMEQAHKTPEYRKISPFAQIPRIGAG